MRDVEFTLSEVPGRYQDIVQRLAVLRPICGVIPDDLAVQSKTLRLQAMWRARVMDLVKVGFLQDARPRVSVGYARNCAPAFAISRPQTRCCHNRGVCPFCYARQVRSIWQKLDSACEAPDSDGGSAAASANPTQRRITLPRDTASGYTRSRQFAYQLVERYHTFFRDVTVPDGTIESTLPALLASIVSSRSQIVQLLNPMGAFCFTSIEPYRDKQWKIRHRQLFKVPLDFEMPENIVTATNGSIAYHPSPTRGVVLQCVARVCAYPRALLTGDPQRVATLLHVRKLCKFRSYAGFRAFRGTQ